MTYHFKFGNKFYYTAVFFFIYTIVFSDDLFRHQTKDIVAICLLIFLFGPFLVKHIASYVINKPMLTINESYIFDHFNDRKYYWNDIEEIHEDKGYLRITLYDQIKYVDQAVRKSDNFFSKLLRRPYDKNNIF